MVNKIIATWNIELYCECPACKEYVNLLDLHGTDASKGFEVCCPACGHEFIAYLEY